MSNDISVGNLTPDAIDDVAAGVTDGLLDAGPLLVEGTVDLSGGTVEIGGTVPTTDATINAMRLAWSGTWFLVGDIPGGPTYIVPAGKVLVLEQASFEGRTVQLFPTTPTPVVRAHLTWTDLNTTWTYHPAGYQADPWSGWSESLHLVIPSGSILRLEGVAYNGNAADLYGFQWGVYGYLADDL